MQGRMSYITVRFVADETNVLFDRDGKVAHGNPDRVTETIDIWTFGRDVKSRSPAWLVYETRDENAAGQDHKTVPDAQI
jgi:predicted lipid-binding transport protein (Tim44 family)